MTKKEVAEEFARLIVSIIRRMYDEDEKEKEKKLKKKKVSGNEKRIGRNSIRSV